MAGPRTSKIKRGKPGRKPTGRPRLTAVLSVKGTDEWADWLKRVADRKGIARTKVMDEAFRFYAAKEKLEPPPSREGA